MTRSLPSRSESAPTPFSLSLPEIVSEFYPLTELSLPSRFELSEVSAGLGILLWTRSTVTATDLSRGGTDRETRGSDRGKEEMRGSYGRFFPYP